jgi:hypothetical protein
MSDEIEDDIHDQMIKAFIRYSAANQKFELFGYKNAAIEARNALTKITQLAKVRRQEIWDKRIKIHGHERKGIPPTPKDQI